MEARTVAGITEFLDFTRQARSRWGDTWWRGHSDANWALVPGVFRAGIIPGMEAQLTGRFRAKARSRSTMCPSDTDPAAWLSLMQHYRLPTRLLDWTELPLVALYFAVNELRERDATVWALNPYTLNTPIVGSPALESPNGRNARSLILSAFNGKSKAEGRVLALVPSEIDLRMLLQGSAFTVHDGPQALDAHPLADDVLMRCTIPAAAKLVLRADLDSLGVRRSNLFPDLENLAADLRRIGSEPEPMTSGELFTLLGKVANTK